MGAAGRARVTVPLPEKRGPIRAGSNYPPPPHFGSALGRRLPSAPSGLEAELWSELLEEVPYLFWRHPGPCARVPLRGRSAASALRDAAGARAIWMPSQAASAMGGFCPSCWWDLRADVACWCVEFLAPVKSAGWRRRSSSKSTCVVPEWRRTIVRRLPIERCLSGRWACRQAD